jgi:hypothetical protein
MDDMMFPKMYERHDSVTSSRFVSLIDVSKTTIKSGGLKW